MSADHRKPVVAFVLLALAATALIGAQRAEAQRGQFLAAVIAAGGQGEAVHGLIRPTSAEALEVARARVATLGPVFVALADGSGRVGSRRWTRRSHPPSWARSTGPASPPRSSSAAASRQQPREGRPVGPGVPGTARKPERRAAPAPGRPAGRPRLASLWA